MPGFKQPSRVTRSVRNLYDNARFKMALIVFDIAVVMSFLILTFIDRAMWVLAVELALGVLIFTEVTGRIVAAEKRLKCLLRPWTQA